MQIEIIGKKGRTLRSINHGGQTYIEAPEKGEYKIRLRNTSANRRLAIVSVDGVNVLDGKDAGFDGRGYVLRPWETIDIPGWMRSDSKVAKFEFKEQGGSYAAQTGRGVSNVGVIGVAVYDEKVNLFVPYVPPVQFVPVYPTYPNNWNNVTYGAGTSYSANSFKSSPRGSSGGVVRNRMMKSSGNDSDTMGAMPEAHARGMSTMDSDTGRVDGQPINRIGECMEQKTSGGLFQKIGDTGTTTCSAAPAGAASMDYMNVDMERGVQEPTKSAPTRSVQDVGTGYGHEASFYTETTTFNRATTSPAFVVSVRYATRERLLSWGVPIDTASPAPMAPNPFPSSMPAVPAPPGWRG